MIFGAALRCNLIRSAHTWCEGKNPRDFPGSLDSPNHQHGCMLRKVSAEADDSKPVKNQYNVTSLKFKEWALRNPSIRLQIDIPGLRGDGSEAFLCRYSEELRQRIWRRKKHN